MDIFTILKDEFLVEYHIRMIDGYINNTSKFRFALSLEYKKGWHFSWKVIREFDIIILPGMSFIPVEFLPKNEQASFNAFSRDYVHLRRKVSR